ncbi:MAG: ATP-binding protein [Betaproteobacteria bacterium]|nr:ATP-binding protein [Betaproteobacteria bacterium]
MSEQSPNPVPHGPDCPCNGCETAARFGTGAEAAPIAPAAQPTLAGSITASDGVVRFVMSRDDQGRDVARIVRDDPDLEPGRWRALLVEGCLLRQNGEPRARAREALSAPQRKMLSVLESGPGPRNALLWGPTGTGKTELALLALRTLHRKPERVMAFAWSRAKGLFTPPELDDSGLTERRVLDRFTAPAVLLLDELGGGHPGLGRVSDFECRVFAEILSTRDRAGRHTWITTNLSPARLAELYPEPALSRLVRHDASLVLDFTGMRNWRRNA